MMTLNRRSNIEVNKTYGGWDFTYDGQYADPRVKGDDKRKRAKHRRRIEKEWTRREINEDAES